MFNLHGYIHSREVVPAAPQRTMPMYDNEHQNPLAPKSHEDHRKKQGTHSPPVDTVKRGAAMNDNVEKVRQQFECFDKDWENFALKSSPTAVEGTEANLLEFIEQIAVILVAISVKRTDFLSRSLQIRCACAVM